MLIIRFAAGLCFMAAIFAIAATVLSRDATGLLYVLAFAVAGGLLAIVDQLAVTLKRCADIGQAIYEHLAQQEWISPERRMADRRAARNAEQVGAIRTAGAAVVDAVKSKIAPKPAPPPPPQQPKKRKPPVDDLPPWDGPVT